MLISKSEARPILEPHLNRLWECISPAWETLQRQHGYTLSAMSPRSRASFMHDLMITNAEEHFEGVEGVRIIVHQNLFLVNIQEKLLIRFKKLNSCKRPSNIYTQQTLSFMEQEMELPGIPPRPTGLIAGYELNSLQTEIQAVILTCPNGARNEWHLELKRQPETGIVILPTAIEEVGAPKRVRVKETVKEIKKFEEAHG